jgi:hypothetical protein
MSKKVLFLTAIILFASAHAVEADVVHSTWVGGEWGEWARASNWNPASLPDNNSWQTFIVTIDNNSIGLDEINVGLQQSRTIDQLDCYGNVELQKWTSDWVELIMVDPNGLTNHGHLVTVGFVIGGNVTNTTGAMLELEDTEIEGDLYNQAGATIEVYEISDEVLVEGDVENAGSIILTPVCNMYVDSILHNTGRINIYGGGCVVYDDILDNNDTGIVQGFGVVFAEQLQNKGKIYAYGGSLSVVSEGTFLNSGILANYPLSSLHIRSAEDVNNLGTIEVNAGGGVAFDCNLVNETNSVIKLRGGTLAATSITQSAGATFEGFGGITGNVMINPNGLIELIGPTNIVGDVTVEHNAVLEISNGQTLIVGHTTNDGEIRVVKGDVVFHGGYSGNGVVDKN